MPAQSWPCVGDAFQPIRQRDSWTPCCHVSSPQSAGWDWRVSAAVADLRVRPPRPWSPTFDCRKPHLQRSQRHHPSPSQNPTAPKRWPRSRPSRQSPVLPQPGGLTAKVTRPRALHEPHPRRRPRPCADLRLPRQRLAANSQGSSEGAAQRQACVVRGQSRKHHWTVLGLRVLRLHQARRLVGLGRGQ